MTPLTVACVFVKGPYPYTSDYVVRLERMVRRYLSRPFRFVCLTDQPAALPTIETIPITSLEGLVPRNGVGYWNKMRLFDPAIGLEGRVLYLDLDTLVVADLDPIVDFKAVFALTTDAFLNERPLLDKDRDGRRVVRRFNGSVMVFDVGVMTEAMFQHWNLDAAQLYSTDQDWIAAYAKEARGMPLEWFPRISQVQPPWPNGTKVVLTKKPKNAIWAEQHSWFNKAWGGWR